MLWDHVSELTAVNTKNNSCWINQCESKMKIFFVVLVAVTIAGCQTVSVPITECNLNGYSFCVKLPKNLRFTNESKGPDFIIFSSNDFENDYGVYFYEGDYEIEGDGVALVETRGRKKFGDIEYRVDIISVPDADYSVLLTRNDIEFPKSIRIFTNKQSGEKELLDEVLAGVKGCASVEYFVAKCEL